MRTQITYLLSILFCAGLIAPAHAGPAAKEQSLVLLPVEGDSSIPQLGEELAQTMGKLGKAVQLSSLKLDDLLLAVECSNTSVACLQKIGQNVKADGLIVATTKKDSSGAVGLSLRWFDVKTGGDSGQASCALPVDPEARADKLVEAIQALFRLKLSSTSLREPAGGLAISSSVANVEIVMNGEPRGVAPLELRNLKVGKYDITARREGYVTWQGTTEVKVDQMTRLEIEMISQPAAPNRTGYINAIKAPTWIVAGAGVVSLAIGGAFGAHMRVQQNEMNEINGVTPSQIKQMQAAKDAGERDALAANICFGLGGGALLTAVILSYIDYRRANSPRDSGGKSARLLWGPGSVGLDVSF
jgi:hypothetical protein